jgi:hypothetical protein
VFSGNTKTWHKKRPLSTVDARTSPFDRKSGFLVLLFVKLTASGGEEAEAAALGFGL